MAGRRIRIAAAIAGLVVLAAAVTLYRIEEASRESGAVDDWFEDAIVAFEAADATAAPPPAGIVFVGSSSIRFWSTLAEDMAGLPVVNRGFGGAHMNHLVHNVDRVVTRYAPRMVVVYAGDNDLQAGSPKTAETVLADYRRFVARVHAKLPETVVYFLSIKPSPRRLDRWPEMRRANALVEAASRDDARLRYIDVASVMLDADGQPRGDLFLIDRLHMNATGYALWTRAVRPVLAADFAAITGGREHE